MRNRFALLCVFGVVHYPSINLVAAPDDFARLTFHRGPKPLAKNAETSEWPRFNGPSDNAVTPEKPLLKKWPGGAPVLLWEVRKGEGYASPAIRDDRLIIFHRLEGKEVVECLDPETGKRHWEHAYPVDYRDRYGYSNGPRASPVVDGGFVYLHGVTAWLTCLELATGKLVWKRDLVNDFSIPQYFFGKGSNPVVAGDKQILNVGG